MEISSLLSIIILLFILGIILYIVNPLKINYSNKNFKCIRCGKCCRFRVRLSNQDIKRIKTKVKINFIDKEGKIPYLKKKGNMCIFLEYRGNKANCKIHDLRPKVCRLYPKVPIFGLPLYDSRCSIFDQPKTF